MPKMDSSSSPPSLGMYFLIGILVGLLVVGLGLCWLAWRRNRPSGPRDTLPLSSSSSSSCSSFLVGAESDDAESRTSAPTLMMDWDAVHAAEDTVLFGDAARHHRNRLHSPAVRLQQQQQQQQKQQQLLPRHGRDGRPQGRAAVRLATSVTSVSACGGAYCVLDPETATLDQLAAACVAFGTQSLYGPSSSSSSGGGGGGGGAASGPLVLLGVQACPCDVVAAGSSVPASLVCASVSAAMAAREANAAGNGGGDPAADCVYGTWSAWSPCPQDCTYKCGESRPQRFRTAPILKPAGPGGVPCEWTSMFQTAECAAPDSEGGGGGALPFCLDPVNCVVAANGWSDWTACPPCSDGFDAAWQFRYGSISQLAGAGGIDCRPEDLVQSRSCALAAATGLVPPPSDDPNAGCNGGGGGGGAAQPCVFSPLVDDLDHWSQCTVPCGGTAAQPGYQFQERTLVSGDPNECDPSATVYRTCSMQPCGASGASGGGGVPPSWDMVNAQCDYLCLAGTPALPLGGDPSRVARSATFSLANGTFAVVTPAETAFVCPTAASLGLSASATLTETLGPNVADGLADDGPFFVNTFSGVACGAPVDCLYGTWSDWSECSGDFCATDGGGAAIRSRQRGILRMGGARGGVPCDPEALFETVPCGTRDTARSELADCLRSAAFAGALVGTLSGAAARGALAAAAADDSDGGVPVLAACRAAFPTGTVAAAQWNPRDPASTIFCFGDAQTSGGASGALRPWTDEASVWCGENLDGGYDARGVVLIASLAVWPASALPATTFTGPGFFDDAVTGAAVVVPPLIGTASAAAASLNALFGSGLAGLPPPILRGYAPPLTVNLKAHPVGTELALSSVPGAVSPAEETLAGFSSCTIWGAVQGLDTGYAVPQEADAWPPVRAASRVVRADCADSIDCVPGPWFDTTACDPNGCGDPPYKWQNRVPLVQASGGGKPCADFVWQQTVSCPASGFGCDAATPCLYGTWPSTQTSSASSYCASALAAAGFTADSVPFFQDALSVPAKRAWLADPGIWPVLNKQWPSISSAAVPATEVFPVIRYTSASGGGGAASVQEAPMDRTEAAAACAVFGGALASSAELEAAQAAGAQVCAWGWTADGGSTTVAFPMQYDGVSGCGVAGLNTYTGTDASGIAYCVGDTRGFRPLQSIGSLSLLDAFNHYESTLSAEAQPSARAAAWAAAGVNAPFLRDVLGGPAGPVEGALAVRLNMQCANGNWCTYDSDLDLATELTPTAARGWGLQPNYGWRRFDGASGAIAGEDCLLATSLSARQAQTIQVSQTCVPLEQSCGLASLSLWDPTVPNFGQAPGACVCPSLCPYVPEACAWDTSAAGSGLCEAVGCGMRTSKLMFRGIQQQPSEACTDAENCACEPAFLASATTCVGPPCPPACPVACNGLPCGGPGVGTCNTVTGLCACASGRGGDDCWATCPSDSFGEVCGGHGTCDATTNECVCDDGFSGPACSFRKHAYVQNFARVSKAYARSIEGINPNSVRANVPAPAQCASTAGALAFCDVCFDLSLPQGVTDFVPEAFPMGSTGEGTPWLRTQGTLPTGAGAAVQYAEFPGLSCEDLGFATEAGPVLSAPLGVASDLMSFATGSYSCARGPNLDWTECGAPAMGNPPLPGITPPIGLTTMIGIQEWNVNAFPLYLLHYANPAGQKPAI